MRTVIILAVLSASCGNPDCDYETNNLCFVSEKQIDVAEVRQILDIMDEEIAVYYPETRLMSKALEDLPGVIPVTVTDGILVANCRPAFHTDMLTVGADGYICDTEAGGMNKDGNEIVIKNFNCLFASALPHELLHTWEVVNFGNAPMDHMRPHVFSQSVPGVTGYDEIIEWNIYASGSVNCNYEKE